MGVPLLAYSASRLICGLSVLIAEWQFMQEEAGTMLIMSPGSGFGWHILHCIFIVPACILWLNAMGWRGASAAVVAPPCASWAGAAEITQIATMAASQTLLICCVAVTDRPNIRRRASTAKESSWLDFANPR